MTMLSPLGRVPRRGPGRPGRRAWPAYSVLTVLVVLAVIVWWNVFTGTDNATGTTAAIKCRPKVTDELGGLEPSAISVRVYNSTDRTGLAGQSSDELSQRGFDVAETANDPTNREVAGVGEIRFGQKGAQRAVYLSFEMPGAVLVRDTRSDDTVDIVLGPDFQGFADPAQASSAIKEAANGGEVDSDQSTCEL